MSTENSSPALTATGNGKESSSVQLFQRAHQKMLILQRVDDQIQSLMNQRRSVQDELRGIQVQINEEFDKLIRTGNTNAAPRLLAEIGDIRSNRKSEAASRDEDLVEVE